MSFTAELVRRVRAVTADELPDDVIELARSCVLDWFGVTLAGSREPAAAIVADELGTGAGGPATVVGRSWQLGTRDAALANGTASHALDYDDVNQAMYGHPSVPILPALLALAEVRRSSGSEVVTAFVAGYEAECALARALGGDHYQRGFHATATVGTVGAALACARLLGLGADATEMAVGIAVTQAAGLKAMFGTMCKPLHAGLASSAGLLSALLAARGFTSARGAVETVQGFAETHSASFDPDRGLARPTAGWHLRSHLFKYHAACYETHSAIEGVRRIAATSGLGPDQVESVTIHADSAQLRMCAIEEPTTGLETKFSLRHTAALVLVGRDTSAIETFSDSQARDPVVVAMRDRVRVVADRAPGGPTPVEIRTTDGRVLQETYDVAVPETDRVRRAERLTAKFSSLAVPVVGAERADRIAAAVHALDQLADLRLLMAASAC